MAKYSTDPSGDFNKAVNKAIKSLNKEEDHLQKKDVIKAAIFLSCKTHN